MIRPVEILDMDNEERNEWCDVYDRGFEEGKAAGKLKELESFLSMPLDADISFELSEKGKDVYRKGLWRTLRSLYGTRLNLMASDKLEITLSLVAFAKIFGPYARKHGTDAFAGLIKDRSVKLNEVTLKFKTKKLIDVKEITLDDTIL